jgi:SAM-dependent methyltransferase
MVQLTGERAGWGEGFEYDESRHLAAYRYARTLAQGKRVLDAGCGEGFGTRVLAEVADSVLGVDYAVDAIEICRQRWHEPNLRFRLGDFTAEDGLDESFDLVCNFQVLEHMEDEIGFLRRLRALLAPAGTLLLTTPNVLKSFSENPYHLREYRAEELRLLLEKVFDNVTLLGMHGNAKVTAFDAARERAVKRIMALDPLGLRHRLPDRVTKAAFARASLLVRHRARTGGNGERITPEDFSISADTLDESLDLVALCRVRG